MLICKLFFVVLCYVVLFVFETGSCFIGLELTILLSPINS
jgi:hypothetical protein